jgi:hypothetical protein
VIPLEYSAFSNESLAAMHFCARGAMTADDEMTLLGLEPRFRVRQTPAWSKHIEDLEAEMRSRGMTFERIELSKAPSEAGGAASST